jgi:hypothetical protein
MVLYVDVLSICFLLVGAREALNRTGPRATTETRGPVRTRCYRIAPGKAFIVKEINYSLISLQVAAYRNTAVK